VLDLARRDGGLRIALVGATIEDARKVMVTGKSGLLAVAQTGEDLRFAATEGIVRFPSGAEAYLYSGACPAKLRGPEHHFAWCDEIAKWRHAQDAWDNLQLGLRLGEAPRALVTTTPKATPLLRKLAAGAEAAGMLSCGRMQDNLNLPPGFVAGMEAAYRGTRQGREELDGELVFEADGALWTRDLLERCRMGTLTFPRGGDDHGERGGESECPLSLKRIVIGVDPPASAEGDACGIIACAVDEAGVGIVLGDHSVRGLSPEGWASAVVAAARLWGADCVIVEKNQGGDMVKSVLHAADRALPVRDVFARYGKGDRAEPVAMLFEGGRVRIAGSFPDLEDELCAMVRGGGYAGPGRSPDRADAMVWALTELMLGRERAEPAVRRL
jgi:phage terminase large subunit-like protein